MRVKRDQIFSYISIIVILLFPILSPYKFIGPISIGHTLVYCVSVAIIFNKRNVLFNKNIALLICIHIFLSLISSFIQTDYLIKKTIINNCLLLLINSFAFMQHVQVYEKENAKKIIPWFLILTVGFLIYQLIYIIIGIEPSTGQLFEELVSGYSWSNSTQYRRPNSLFSEPSYFSIFILPLLGIYLMEKKYIVSIILIISLVLSTSSLGIIGGIIIFIYIIITKYDIKTNFKMIMITVLIISIIILVNFDANLQWIISSNIQKMSNLHLESQIRFTGNIEYFNNIPDFNKIIGVGMGQISSFLGNMGISTSNYSNLFIVVLFNYGIIGFITLIIVGIKLFLEINKKYRVLIITMFTISCIDYFIYTSNFYYVLFFILVYSKNYKIRIK